MDSWGYRWRGSIGIVVLVPLAVLSLLAPRSSGDASWLRLLTDTLAWLTFVTGGVLRLASTLYIGGRKRTVLVTDGTYSVCRNPLYVGTVLLAVSAGLFLESWPFTAGALLVAVGYAVATVPVEERYLRERFGAAYVEYCSTVPRYWPRPSQFRTAARIEVDVQALRKECWRAVVSWAWIPLIGEIVEQLRVSTWWPHLFRFS
jgi:protein-S-isoprenylcysteine O-methyltransferase Ste14